jgi:DUF917 family protein
MARLIGQQEIEDIALGAAVLGTGGGGDPYIGKLMAVRSIRDCGPARMVSADEIDDDSQVAMAAMMGAPTVMVEKLPSGKEVVDAFLALQAYLGRKIDYTTSAEAGGLNSTIPFTVAARLNIPIVDADGMGRAFPELQMVTPTMYGISATPMAIGDEKDNRAVINTPTNRWTETVARTITIDMGSTALIALYPMSGRQLKEGMVLGTLSRAERIGRALRTAHELGRDALEVVAEVTRGQVFFRGKVADVQRRTERGFARGEAHIEGTGGDAGRNLVIHFQNEALMAMRDGEAVVSVPDLIVVLDAETGQPITTEGLRYGFRVAVLSIPCDPKWRTPAGLALVGPRYFGYDVEYAPAEARFGQ